MKKEVQQNNFKRPRKITIKEVCGRIDLDKVVKAQKSMGGVLYLMDVAGFARKAKPGQSKLPSGDISEYVRFLGQFQAVNHETGEMFRSSAGIFPKVIEEELYGALGVDVQEVQFAFRVGIRYDETAATKYVYVAESLIPPAENDPLNLLLISVTAHTKLLEEKSTPEHKGKK